MLLHLVANPQLLFALCSIPLCSAPCCVLVLCFAFCFFFAPLTVKIFLATPGGLSRLTCAGCTSWTATPAHSIGECKRPQARSVNFFLFHTQFFTHYLLAVSNYREMWRVIISNEKCRSGNARERNYISV